MLSSLRRFAGAVKRRFFPPPDSFLASCRGIIHVGANVGQERFTYASHNLAVVWIEPLPEQFAILQSNIQEFDNQTAINALITDEDGKSYGFHVSNNNGESSSILDLHLHKDIWPEVRYTHDIQLVSSTLPSALQKYDVNLNDYDALALDTQGSELTILRGAKPILRSFKFIQIEAPDFESYKDCATAIRIRDFMRSVDFKFYRKTKFAEGKMGEKYFDLLFKRN